MASSTSLLTIRSSISPTVLHVNAPVGSYLTVALEGHQYRGKVEVWLETGDVAGLVRFFSDLGELGAPWNGRLAWTSLEGNLGLSATCSSLGVVVFRVAMAARQGSTEEWSLQAGVETEFGQLARIAADAKELARDAT